MQFQFETEKPNAVAFNIPVEGSPASPAKVRVVKERLAKRLSANENEETLTLKEVQDRLEKAEHIRDSKI